MRRAIVLVFAILGCGSHASQGPAEDRDLDDDGTADCWELAGETLSVQPACKGAAIDVAVGGAEIALPPALSSRAWARGIAGVLVGAGAVGCEASGDDCAPPPPALRNRIDRATLPAVPGVWIEQRYVPRWLDGAPAAHAEAVVLDPAATRREPGYDEPPFVAPETDVLVWRPALDELTTIGWCDDWEIRASSAGLVAIDKKTPRWSWVLVNDERDDRTFGDVQCAGDLFLMRGGAGIDTETIEAIDVRTGAANELGMSWSSLTSLIVKGVTRTAIGPLTRRQWQALLATPDDEIAAAGKPCADPAGTPLALLPPGAPCTLSGTGDLDQHGSSDCWTAERDGNRVAGTLRWFVAIQHGCSEDNHDSHHVHGNAPIAPVTFTPGAPEATVRWLAHLFVGDHVGCVPARRGCPLPDAAALWIHDRMAHYGSGVPRRKPIWQTGTPTAPAPSATITPGTPTDDDDGYSTIVFHWPDSEAFHTGTPALSATCDRYEVWTSPGAGAVVDRARRRWAWAYLPSIDFTMGENDYALWPAPITRGWCEDDLAFFELGTDGVIVTEPATGAWLLIDDWKTLDGRTDRVQTLRVRLRSMDRE